MAKMCYQVPVCKIPGRVDVRALRVPQKIRGLWIPRGFVWNGASVPAAAHPIIGTPWMCEFQLASLLHDYLYVTHKATRRNADDWFYNDLRSAGMGVVKAYMCWLAVRMFGQCAWDKADPESHRFLTRTEMLIVERSTLL